MGKWICKMLKIKKDNLYMYFNKLPFDIKIFIIKNYILNKCNFCSKKLFKTFNINNLNLCKLCFDKENIKLQDLFDNND